MGKRAVAVRESAPSAETLPAMIEASERMLNGARTSAEYIEAMKGAELTLHVSRLVGATGDVQANCLRMVDRAQKLVGEQLLKLEKSKGGGDPKRSKDHRSRSGTGGAPTLDELGVTKKQSAEWQDRARVTDAVVERALKEALAKGRAPTKADIKRAVRKELGKADGKKKEKAPSPAEAKRIAAFWIRPLTTVPAGTNST